MFALVGLLRRRTASSKDITRYSGGIDLVGFLREGLSSGGRPIGGAIPNKIADIRNTLEKMLRELYSFVTFLVRLNRIFHFEKQLGFGRLLFESVFVTDGIPF